MLKRLTPFTVLALAASAGVVAASIALFIALHQPWLGLGLEADAKSGLVRIADVAPSGPAATLRPGETLTRIGDITLEAGDLVEEPDLIDKYVTLERFLDRQSQLHAALEGASLTVETGLASATQLELTPEPSRPITSLPLIFWAQIFTGLISMVVGAWVWCLRPAELSARLLALASLGMLSSSFAAAIYSTREIALPGALLRVLSAINHFGALTVGVAMLALFLVYPRRLIPPRTLWLLFAVYASIWVMDTGWVGFSGPTEGIYLPFLILTAGIVIAVLVQYGVGRADPAARAALKWLALSVALSAVIYGIVVLMPLLFGMPSLVPQGYAFALFGTLYYLGVAAGVARYRLFELDSWALSILTNFGAVALLALLDALLISLVAIERPAAFAISLLVVALLYLPCRDWLARRLMPQPDIDREDLFGRIVDIALSNDAVRQSHWRRVLQDVFSPLQMSHLTGTAPQVPTVTEDGIALLIPSLPGMTPLKLSYAHSGRRLFSPRDRRFAAEICTMLGHAIASRHAHEKGAAEERIRIARDIHDNMGAQLLSALHSETPERKDTLIRETISDLRDIVNNAAQGGKSIDELLADLKVEALERLSSANISLDWQNAYDDGDIILAPNVAHSLRSVLREVISNTIRHSGAQRMRVTFEIRNGTVMLDVSDDGSGLPSQLQGNGSGLSNVEARLLALKGTLVLEDAEPGLAVRARFPLTDGVLA